jgi:hypothetical protein
MLLFRSEEHVGRWCAQWQLPKGALLSLDLAWRLAVAWFAADRGAPDWQRPSLAEVRQLFASFGLTSPFWELP